MHRTLNYLYIVATIIITAYGQLILKWRIACVGPLPADTVEKSRSLISLLFDPAIFYGFAAAVLAHE
jgi:hypothetical protein